MIEHCVVPELGRTIVFYFLQKKLLARDGRKSKISFLHVHISDFFRAFFYLYPMIPILSLPSSQKFPSRALRALRH